MNKRITKSLKKVLNSTVKCNSIVFWKNRQAVVQFVLFLPQNMRCTNGFIQTAYP